MRTIWKYEVEIADKIVLDLRVPHRVIHVGKQNPDPHTITFWVLEDTEAPQRPRLFHIVGTGHEVPEPLTADDHVGTVIDIPFGLVWHVFEGGR